jgi:alanyl aminopeptidase
MRSSLFSRLNLRAPLLLPRLVLLAGLTGLGSLSCSGNAYRTPPIYATLPAPDRDLEKPPTNGRLPADVTPVRYTLALTLDPRQKGYRGQVEIELMLDRPRESVWLHNLGPRVYEVSAERPGAGTLVGQLEQVVAPSAGSGQVPDSGLAALRFKQPIGPGPVTVRLRFEADFGTRLAGLYRVDAGGDAYAFTQFEAISAREAFPCFDEPRFKTPFDVRVTVPAGLTVIGNTQPESTRSVAAAHPLAESNPDAGLTEVRFKPTEKLPTYLLALAVGPLDVVKAPALPAASGRGALPLSGVAVKGRGAALALALADTPRLLARLEDYFGIGYPYDKLDLIAVPDFGAGAMENAGAITFRDTLLLLRPDASEWQRRAMSSVNAHELAHQWFGNLVTMPWWDDIWLNESFATWMGARVIDEVHPEHKAKLSELSGVLDAMDMDSQAAARKIRQPIETDHDIANAFDMITYEKGGAVLSMFERYLGADAFRAGLRLYMQRHRFGSATAADLVAALAEAGQRAELPAAFNTFLEQPGVPLVALTPRCAADGVSLSLRQSRFAPIGSTIDRAARWQIPVCVRYASDKGSEERCMLLRDETTSWKLDNASCPRWVLPNSGAAGYYRYQLDASALDALVLARKELGEGEQLALANNLVATMRAGGLSAEPALTALSALADLPSRLVLEQILEVFAALRDKLLGEGEEAGYRARLAHILAPLYASLGIFPKATPSGDEKLLRARVVRALALDARHEPLLSELAGLGRALLGVGAEARLGELPSELIEPALSAALRSGDDALLTRAIDKLRNESDGTVRSRLLSALSNLDQPAQSERVLLLSLDPALRVNERLSPLYGQMARRETRAQAYAFLKQHYDALSAALSERGTSHVLGVIGHFCSPAEVEDAKSFFSVRAEKLPGGPRELSLALESGTLCAAFSLAQKEGVQRYFANAEVRAQKASKRAKRASETEQRAPKPASATQKP